MRFASLLLLALPGASQASEHGRVVRVEKQPTLDVYIPAGTFTMGVSDPNETGDQSELDDAVRLCKQDFKSPEVTVGTSSGPTARSFCDDYAIELSRMSRRTVTLDAFYIDRDEVSVAAYRRCVAAGGCGLEPLVGGDERYIRDEWPMVNITWSEAQTFCQWRGGSLPTEAQWEHAARGNDRRPWPWGDTLREHDFNHGQASSTAMRETDTRLSLLYVDYVGDPDGSDGFALIAPPGRYTWGAGPYGTRDQAGNVAEWTLDLWASSIDVRQGYDLLDQKTGEWGHLGSINPVREGPATEPHVVRGGSWRQPAWLSRTNLRDPFNVLYNGDHRFSHIGFRCARSAR